MAKRHDENKCLRSFNRIGRVDMYNKTLQAPKNAVIGIHLWGKIDYLTKYCGWYFIYNNDATPVYNQNSDDGTHIIKTFNLQCSNDTTNGIDGKWTDITTINNDKPSTRRGETTYNITNNEYYKAYRIFITKTGYHTAVTELQFYGR